MRLYKSVSFLLFCPSEMAIVIAHGCLASCFFKEATTGPSLNELHALLAFHLVERSIHLKNSPIIYI